jgi:hypothetical protein
VETQVLQRREATEGNAERADDVSQGKRKAASGVNTQRLKRLNNRSSKLRHKRKRQVWPEQPRLPFALPER